MVSILEKIIRKNKGQIVTKQWLMQTYMERVNLGFLSNADGTINNGMVHLSTIPPVKYEDKETILRAWNEKYMTYPVHPLDWTTEELRELWTYFEQTEKTAKAIDLAFKEEYPDFEQQLNNIKGEGEKKELIKKKETFMQKKLAMKARFAANKTQTLKAIIKKFMRRKKFFVKFIKGKNKFSMRSKIGKYYKRTRNSHLYKDHILLNKKHRQWKWRPLKHWYYRKYRKARRILYPKRDYFNIVRLYIRKTYSNIFFTLTDINNKVIYTVSTGMVTPLKNLKVSRSQDILEKMIKNLKDKLNFIKIRHLQVILKSKARWHYRILKGQLKKFGIRVISIMDRRIAAHNGVRRKNKPVK